jgi:hypothetical protein
MIQTKQGEERERDLPLEAYCSDQYFEMPQLFSFAHQLQFIRSMRPESVIEVGVGNGFVSTFLRKTGVSVTTADINPALNPDICAPLSEVASHLNASHDLVICCEVLEHMPLDQLDQNLDHLLNLGDRLFLTLPNSFRTIGFSISTLVPKFGNHIFDFNLTLPFKHNIIGGPHFWEVGFNTECSRNSIIKKLKQRYSKVRSGRFKLNPYHIWFVCE